MTWDRRIVGHSALSFDGFMGILFGARTELGLCSIRLCFTLVAAVMTPGCHRCQLNGSWQMWIQLADLDLGPLTSARWALTKRWSFTVSMLGRQERNGGSFRTQMAILSGNPSRITCKSSNHPRVGPIASWINCNNVVSLCFPIPSHCFPIYSRFVEPVCHAGKRQGASAMVVPCQPSASGISVMFSELRLWHGVHMSWPQVNFCPRLQKIENHGKIWIAPSTFTSSSCSSGHCWHSPEQKGSRMLNILIKQLALTVNACSGYDTHWYSTHTAGCCWSLQVDVSLMFYDFMLQSCQDTWRNDPVAAENPAESAGPLGLAEVLTNDLWILSFQEDGHVLKIQMS